MIFHLDVCRMHEFVLHVEAYITFVALFTLMSHRPPGLHHACFRVI